MSLQFLGKNRLALVILLCIAMLVLLGALQFAWTGQLSEAQAAMMQNALANSVRQFEQEVERELMFLLALMRPEGRGGQQLDWNRCAEGYSLWAETSAHAGLLSRILVYQVGRDGEARLQELPLGEAEPVEAEWELQLEPVERALARAAGRPGRGRGPFTWTLFPEGEAVVRPIAALDRLRRGPARGPRSGGSAFIVVVLDWSYVAQQMLPELVDRLFSGADGERLYEVAIAVRDGENGERFLYRSDPSIDAAWLAGADMRRRPRLFRSPPERPGPPLAGPAGGPDPIRRLALEAGRDERAGAAVGQGQQGGLRSLQGGRGRIAIAGAGTGLTVELAAAHVSGSLAGAVARQRARNLGAGLGVLLLLAGAMALVVVSARRAARLAAMQMEFIAGV